ncbi:MAG: hypothetical protein C5B50_06805 [Verrucomicrobia bacterium]|nr:MAG: hypothetical protein C5B50_06805 [Verrucomicrobiota bacterium]
MPSKPAKSKTLLWGRIIGAVLTAGVGFLCVQLPPIAVPLARWSYDAGFLPHEFRSISYISDDIVLVYLDSQAKTKMGEPSQEPLKRHYQARLIERLQHAGAKLILFDFLVDSPAPDPRDDEALAKAFRECGKVVPVESYGQTIQNNVFQEAPIPPTEILEKASPNWGLAKIDRDPDDGCARRLDPGLDLYPSLSWRAAALLGAAVTRTSPAAFTNRWINYYGRPQNLRTFNYDLVLAPDGLSDANFRDKIVVLCAEDDQRFGTPWSRLGWQFATGAQIHALSLLNLLHGDWLETPSQGKEVALVILCGLLLGAGLASLRPWPAVGAAFLAILTIAAASMDIQLRHHLWWSWLVPIVSQTPFALVWSVGYQYVFISRRRKQLHRALAGYYSRQMADRISDDQFDLSLGGEEVETTVMFTDLEGFTNMSENLSPKEVSAILIAYFSQTTRAILDREGMIVKYLGDSVMAVWNTTLLDDPHHADHAVMAGWELFQKGEQEIAGRRLRTRIGINSGPGLAGNLGSEFRFDYSVIGDTTNLASRLESLNKQLGTGILLSQSTLDRLTVPVQTRALGRFLVSGRTQPVAIHELLGTEPRTLAAPKPGEGGLVSGQPSQEWIGVFNDALRCFTEGKLDAAEHLFRQVIQLRGADGPSEFYLQQIAAARQTSSAHPRDGIVRLTSK